MVNRKQAVSPISKRFACLKIIGRLNCVSREVNCISTVIFYLYICCCFSYNSDIPLITWEFELVRLIILTSHHLLVEEPSCGHYKTAAFIQHCFGLKCTSWPVHVQLSVKQHQPLCAYVVYLKKTPKHISQSLLTLSVWSFRFFFCFSDSCSSLSLSTSVPSWAAASWILHWTSFWRVRRWEAHTPKKHSALSINTEVLSLTTPSQHILKNTWLPSSAPWRPASGSFDPIFSSITTADRLLDEIMFSLLYSFRLNGLHTFKVSIKMIQAKPLP